jgi:hypothetical protein
VKHLSSFILHEFCLTRNMLLTGGNLNLTGQSLMDKNSTSSPLFNLSNDHEILPGNSDCLRLPADTSMFLMNQNLCKMYIKNFALEFRLNMYHRMIILIIFLLFRNS